MNRKYRLTLFISSLILIIIIGRSVTGSFEFIASDFWFVSGILLIFLLSLIDQPFFSTEANIFVNSVTALMSLLLIQTQDRSIAWYTFLGLTIFLLITSYAIMWIRKNPLKKEPVIIKVIYLTISKIGRPECIFSIFFIWGLIRKFGVNSYETNSFLLFWGLFIILHLPEVINKITNGAYLKFISSSDIGILSGFISPSIAIVQIKNKEMLDTGTILDFYYRDDKISTGILIDDRLILGKRIGKISIQKQESQYFQISNEKKENIYIKKSNDQSNNLGIVMSSVDRGTELGKLCFYLNPKLNMIEGEIVWVTISNNEKGFYQVISASLVCETENSENSLFSTKVIAGQLGKWNTKTCRFEPINWVPQAGEMICKSNEKTIDEITIPDGQLLVGTVPNSKFPVHVNIQDTVTHNTAIIGVTGSGKSYLSFHIIEKLSQHKIKVLVLDLSRQHWIFLEKNNNVTAIPEVGKVEEWYQDNTSYIGIYQFANETSSYPKATADFVEKAFSLVSQVKLKAGENEPAKLCIVFEEAHSLIPEWNQVSQQSDTQCVNRTARFLLQGRKFGLGCMLITQRTANVTKTILNQCNSIFAMQSFDQTGLDFLSNYMGSEYSHTISTLPKQHSILVGKSSSSAHPILFSIIDLKDRYIEKKSCIDQAQPSVATTD